MWLYINIIFKKNYLCCLSFCWLFFFRMVLKTRTVKRYCLYLFFFSLSLSCFSQIIQPNVAISRCSCSSFLSIGCLDVLLLIITTHQKKGREVKKRKKKRIEVVDSWLTILFLINRTEQKKRNLFDFNETYWLNLFELRVTIKIPSLCLSVYYFTSCVLFY